MSLRKIIVYQRYATKPVILTDISNQPESEIRENILKLLSSDKIGIFETTTDCLIFRPSEIQSILITKQTTELESESDKKVKDSAYNEKLNLDSDKK